MRSPSSIRLILRILFIFFLILCIPFVGLLMLSVGPFGELRRHVAEHFLSKAIDVEVAVKGPVKIGFGLTPKVSVKDVVAVESDVPSDISDLSVRSIDLELPVIPLLTGHMQLNALTIDGLMVAIAIPAGETTESQGMAEIGQFISNIVHSPVSSNFELRDTKLDLVDHESGFTLRYVFEAFVSEAKDDGSIRVDAKGELNGEPWNLDGDVDPKIDGHTRKFDVGIQHVGLTTGFAGTYTFGGSRDTVDMTATARAPDLERFLAVYEIQGNLEGAGDLSGRLTGDVTALKASDLVLKLSLKSGDVFTLTGGIDDLSEGTGLELKLDGRFLRPERPKDKEPTLFDIGITGFTGRIEGSYDGVLVRDFRINTNSVNATLNNIGPITGERLYKNEQGQLGLYDVVILAGNPKRPSVRVTGTVKDIIDFKGVDLKGKVDFPTADFFDLAAEKNAASLGHLTGQVALTDADGSLGIELFSAEVTDSSLLKLSIDLVFDDLRNADDLKFATHLDIPKFEQFAAALGTPGEDIGRIKFDGTIEGSDESVELAGTTLVGETTIKGALTGKLSKDKPVLSGELSSPLLHLSDMKKLRAINVAYFENTDEKDIDVIDYSKVSETVKVELKINVAKIAGGGTDASNISGNVTYIAGVVGLDPLSLTYLGGRATSNGKIDTMADPNSFSVKGRVENLPIGAVMKQLGGGSPVRGSLHATYDISGAGNSVAEIPRTLSGSVSSSLRDGWIGSDLINITGLSLPAWLLSRSSGGAELVCVVAPFSFQDGRGSTRSLVLETREVQIVGVGYVDLRRDVLDLRFKPQPLRQKLIDVTQPFVIQGNLKHPQIHLTGAPIANAVAGTFAFPFNLLDSIVQPRAGTPGRVPCRVTYTAERRERETRTRPDSRGPLGLGIFGDASERGGERRRQPQRTFGPRR